MSLEICLQSGSLQRSDNIWDSKSDQVASTSSKTVDEYTYVRTRIMTHSGFTIENNVLKGVDVSYHNDYTSLGEFVLNRLDSHPDFVGQVDCVTGEEYTYSKMRERSVRCALWMKAHDLCPGDVVVISSHNQMDVPMPCFAALYLGAIFNPIDAGLNTQEFRHLLGVTKPKMAFVSREVAPVICQAAEDAHLELKIVVFGQASGFLDFESIVAQSEVDKVQAFRCTAIGRPDAIAIIACTSGTTGSFKGVALSHGAMLRQTRHAIIIGMVENVCLTYSPLFWISGIVCVFMSLFSNIPRLVTPPFEEYSACEIIEKYKVTFWITAPSLIMRLVKSGALNKHKLLCLKRALIGGASITCASREIFAKFLPNVRFITIYAITELGSIISIQTMKSKPESCGHIIENTQLKVVDPYTGRKLGPNEQGELLLKAPTMMNCYYNNPQATVEAVDNDGWMHSGDFGYYDEDGDIFVVDRLKELIKYRCYQVSPAEVESTISSHPGVKDVAVVGVPHPVDDEHPLAFVVSAVDPTGTNQKVTEAELVDLVARQLSDSKHLRGGVRFVDRIPRTASGKIQRQLLREWGKINS